MISPQTTIRGTNVTVQALAGQEVYPKPLLPRQVVITPLQGSQGKVIPKILLKCISKENKKDYKTFYLRSIDPSAVKSCAALKTLIRAQLCGEVEEEFDVGYQQNNVVVNIRSSDDLIELWSNVMKGTNVILWCDGLKKISSVPRTKRPHAIQCSDDDDEPEDASKKKSSKPKRKKKKNADDRNEAVDSSVEKLKELHSNSGYTPMQ